MSYKLKLFITAIVFVCMIPDISAQMETDSIRQVYGVLNKALTSRDIKDILPELHPDFAVSVATRPKSEGYLSSLLEKQVLHSAEFDGGVSLKGDTILAGSVFVDNKGRRSEGFIALDRNYRLLYIDFFDRLYSPSRYGQSRLMGKIPFELNDEGIILKIRLNGSGRELRFLLDTGADGMAIRKSLGDSLGLVAARRQQAQVVGGSAQIGISSHNRVHLADTLFLENQNIALFEQVGHSGIDGILGLNVAYSYIMHVDFDENMISLFSMGVHRFGEKGRTIDITVPHGVIRLPASIDIAGGKEVAGSFVFDTGANYHVICFEGFVRRNRLLLSGFKSQGQGATVSMGISSPVYYGRAHRFRLGSIPVEDMPVTLQASTGRTIRADEPDGSIGIQLLKGFNFTIDLLGKKVHLWPNRNAPAHPLLPEQAGR